MEKRYSDEDFKRDVSDLVGEEYKFLEKYINNKTSILVKHNTCGRKYKVSPKRFKRGQRCRKCYDSFFDVRTLSDLNGLVKKEVGEEYVFIGEYKGGSRKTLIRHNGCGKEYMVTPSAFLKGGRCVKCPYRFEKEVSDLVGDEYTFIEKYETATKPILVRHNSCGREYQVSPSNFKRGSRCSCVPQKGHKNTEDFKAEVSDLVGGEFSVLSPYIKAAEEVLFSHNVCGSTFGMTPSSFLAGRRCPHCNPNRRKTSEEFSVEVLEKFGPEFEVVGEYIDRETKLGIKHVSCGRTFETTPNYFMSSGTCRKCIFSRGEKAVADVLDSNSVEYTREYSFDLLGRKRFDFFLPAYNIAIEYDGEQHFEAVDHWGGEEALKRTQESDALKNAFCEQNGIDLLRIPYWEFDNIPEIVTDYIDSIRYLGGLLEKV